MLFYDDPALVEEMLAFQANRLITLLRRAAQEVSVDRLFIWEDTCYRNGPLIGSDLFRTFLLPPYRSLIGEVKSLGIPAIDVGSDGDVTALLPLWLEAGGTMLHPFEVQAGMDVNTVQEEYGKDLLLRRGVDKRQLTKDWPAIDRELERIRPAFEKGGYIPCDDHSIPPDVSYDNCRYYTEKRAELVGASPVPG